MKKTYIYRSLALSMLLLVSYFGYAQQTSSVVEAIKTEVERNKNGLKMGNLQPPFYISYALHDLTYFEVRASNGVLVQKLNEQWRKSTPFLLVGSYDKNNALYYGDYMQLLYGDQSNTRPTIENDDKGIARGIWSEMDKLYKSAAENYESKQVTLNMQNRTEEEKNTPDYLKANPVNISIPKTETKLDEAYWENYVRKTSLVMKKYTELLYSDVSTNFREAYTNYYNTEGGQYSIPTRFYSLKLDVSLMTADGQEVSDQLYVEHNDLKAMPDLETFSKQCDEFVKEFVKTKNASMIDESYIGPVLIEGMAMADAVYINFFNQDNSLIAKRAGILASDLQRYYGNNPKAKGNDLEGLMNKKVTSRSISIKSISGLQTYKNMPLEGYFPVDAEGVVPEKEITLVENGVLRNMLNGRTPTKKIKTGNGHMRFDMFRQSNAIIPGNVLMTYNGTTPDSDMKKKLIDAAKEEDLEYAYIVRRMRGNAPIMLYKVNVKDGSEELVRGATIADFNIRSFKRILAASDKEFFMNLAPSGAMTTVVVPNSMLFEELELNKNNGMTLKTPFVVPAP